MAKKLETGNLKPDAGHATAKVAKGREGDGGQGFRILRYEEIAVGLLDKHPVAESYPRGDDDDRSVGTSVDDNGVFQPLTVLDGVDHYDVLDGCTRLDAARKAGLEKVPCIVVECADVERLVLNVNASRRKVSTGTRVLAYITLHKDRVLKASAIAEDPRTTGAMARGVSRDTPFDQKLLHDWNPVAIGERLGASHMDVIKAIELLRCKEHRLCPAHNVGTDVKRERRLEEHSDEEDAKVGKMIDACYLRVLAGDTPVRRWKARFGSHAAAPADGGKATTDWHGVAMRSMASLPNAFGHIGEMTREQRREVLDRWDKVLERIRPIVAQLLG